MSLKLLANLVDKPAPTPKPAPAPESTFSSRKCLHELEEGNPTRLALELRAWTEGRHHFELQEVAAAIGLDRELLQHYMKVLGTSLRLLGYKPRRAVVKGVRISLWNLQAGPIPLDQMSEDQLIQRRPLIAWLDRRKLAFTLCDALNHVYGTDDLPERTFMTMDLKLVKAGCRKFTSEDGNHTYIPPKGLPK